MIGTRLVPSRGMAAFLSDALPSYSGHLIRPASRQISVLFGTWIASFRILFGTYFVKHGSPSVCKNRIYRSFHNDGKHRLAVRLRRPSALAGRSLACSGDTGLRRFPPRPPSPAPLLYAAPQRGTASKRKRRLPSPLYHLPAYVPIKYNIFFNNIVNWHITE